MDNAGLPGVKHRLVFLIYKKHMGGMRMAKKRKCGVLLPVSSLPSKYGIGCFDKKAYEFVDALKEAGQSYWQILPLGPTSYGDSPYQSFSTFAGNPYFISLEELIKEGVLTKKECESMDFGTDETSVDYAKLYEGRMILLRKAYERSNVYMDSEFRRFQEEEAWWLKDYALFMAVKKRRGVNGLRTSVSAGRMRSIITEKKCILKSNFRSICSSNSASSG